MAAQFDFVAGVDISSLSSVTQAQLMQMINQIAPLSNIGGIIVQAGGSLAGSIDQGTNGSPDVTNNPRFARYIWLNTHDAATAAPTPYYYKASNGKWTSTSVAAESITNAEIASNAAIAVSKLAPYGTERYILRTNSNHTAVEYAAPSNIFNANELPVNSLVRNGSDGYLKTTGGGAAVTWVSDAVERQVIQDSIAALPVTQLQSSSNYNILYINPSTLKPAWGAPSTAFASGSNIPLNALAQGGAAAQQLMHYNGTSWAPVTPSLQINSSANISTEGIKSSNTAAVDKHEFTHGLGVRPKLIRVVLVCTTTESPFATDDEVAAESFSITTGSSWFPAISVSTSSTNKIIVTVYNLNTLKLVTSTGTWITATRGSWTPKVYAWA